MINSTMRHTLCVISILMLTVCYSFAEGEKPTKAAEVNGKVISFDDFQRQFELTQEQMTKGRTGTVPENVIQQLRTRVVNQMVAEELLFQESEKQGVKVSPDLVEKELNDLKNRFKDPKQYEETLKRMRLDEERLKKQIMHQAAIRELVSRGNRQ